METPITGVPEATAVQLAQAGELLRSLRNLAVPVVICGDFNSDANFGSGIDATPTVALIEAAGYADDWKVANPGDPGNTWPLYLEDQAPPDFFAPSVPFERIDLFFSRGLQVSSVIEVVAPAWQGPRPPGHGADVFGSRHLPSGPPYGSDHAGVIATYRF